MPRFAANLSLLYPELDFLDRFEAAAADGFRGVEFLFPYAWRPAELAGRLRGHGLQQVLFNAPPGGLDAGSVDRAWQAGDRGLACIPGREAEFRSGVTLALAYARALDCPRIHVMAGVVPAGLTRETVRATFVANLRWAAAEAAHDGVVLLIEPINTRDMPGFFLNRQDHAHELVEEIGAANVQVQMDLYHCQVVEGDVSTKIRRYLPTGRVGHFQVAGVPARQEPDQGELNTAYLFDVIDEVAAACGWQGWVGAEYRPALASVGGTRAGFGWLRRRGGPEAGSVPRP
ncbi:hydroxypyruvate isomerase family protein [Ramlibacter sp. AW1]|uniref:Hydroxypyruvate isomerase family protein n=1 Tax=Ramlibacter aurantiacus TaxID=2801330 RepID=A0A936ZPP7_9BURK|nr:2-oxo-tetronate isomerase [Ramlibacter aurantiacus]MBL0421255.1 hydroxypyruvate isomerase family protein [Ramlibacter aurantiacus]